MVQEVAEVEEIRARQPQPGARFVTAGKSLVTVFALCLLLGNVVVRGFFPEFVGIGLNTTTLAILIPVWILGIIGLLVLLVGLVIGWRAKRCRRTDLRHE